MEALKPILIIPLISSLVVGLAMIYLIGKPVAGILEGLTHWLQTMGTANAVLLGAILGGMMCTDMESAPAGGPDDRQWKRQYNLPVPAPSAQRLNHHQSASAPLPTYPAL